MHRLSDGIKCPIDGKIRMKFITFNFNYFKFYLNKLKNILIFK